MKIFSLSLCLCISVTAAYAQSKSVEDMLSKNIVDCKTVNINALDIIPGLYYSQPIDSVIRAITFWESVCNVTEASQRIKILVAIRNRNFSELLYDSSIVFHIREYRELMRSPRRKQYDFNNYDEIYYSKWNMFNSFTSRIATGLLAVADTTSLEYFFCRLYSNQTDEKEFPDEKRFANTLLLRMKKHEDAVLKGVSKRHMSFGAGIWIPTGNLTVLGNHPDISYLFGLKTVRNRIDIALHARFINSATTYQIRRHDSLINTDHFFSSFIGVEYGREVLSGRKHYFEITGGAGVDGIDVASSNDEDVQKFLKPLSIASFDLNAGIQYNFLLNKRTYLGLHGKYHLVNFANKGGTDFSGKAFTISLVFGKVALPQYYGDFH